MVPFGLTCQANAGTRSVVDGSNDNEPNVTASSSSTTGPSPLPPGTFAIHPHYRTDSLHAALALNARQWRRRSSTLQPPPFQSTIVERGSIRRMQDILGEAIALFDNNDWTSDDSVRSNDHHDRPDYEERQ
jgi:hypothetical protein